MRHDMERVDGGEEAVGGVVLAGTVVVEPKAVHPIQLLAVIAKCNSIFFIVLIQKHVLLSPHIKECYIPLHLKPNNLLHYMNY